MADLNFLPATEIAALVRDRKVSPVEVVEASLARISSSCAHRVQAALIAFESAPPNIPLDTTWLPTRAT